MTANFVGGPLDSLSFTHEQINQIAEIFTLPTQSGLRNYLFMPSPAECTRILKGEMTKTDCCEPRTTYEQLRKADGSVEYHEAGAGIGHTVRQQNAPLTPEQAEMKQLFESKADEFTQQLRSAGITSDTVVNLVLVYRDRQGKTFNGDACNIVGMVTLTGFDPESAKRFADGAALDLALRHIDSLVRNAPTDFMYVPGHPSNMLQICDFELQIIP